MWIGWEMVGTLGLVCALFAVRPLLEVLEMSARCALVVAKLAGEGSYLTSP